jgi:hypothetical protein
MFTGSCPGGGLSAAGDRWIACRPGFFLPVRVLSRLFRRRFIEELRRTYAGGHLRLQGDLAGLTDPTEFTRWLAPLRRVEWVVYAKRPFAGPAAVLAYLSRYTHRVAISNSRLVSMDGSSISFRWKDYRAKGRTRPKTMTLDADEFIRRFLLHVLPSGFHRIRHYGLLANAHRRDDIASAAGCWGCNPYPPSLKQSFADAVPGLNRVYPRCSSVMSASDPKQTCVGGAPISRAPGRAPDRAQSTQDPGIICVGFIARTFRDPPRADSHAH